MKSSRTGQLCSAAALAAALLAPPTLAAQTASPPRPVPAAHATAAPVPTALQVDTVDRIVAIVGSTPITWSDLAAAVNQQRAAGLKLPPDSAGQLAVARGVLGDLVDQEILVEQAKKLGLDVTDAEVARTVDAQIKRVRAQFASDQEYRTELKNAGFGTPEDYRRNLFDQVRRQTLQQKAFQKLIATAPPASVTDSEVTAAYERARTELQKRPATITFRQIVVAPRPSPAADSAARAKADSILVQLQHGADFAEMAKRYSMDPGTKNVGGDLGWNRRGSGLVPEFEAMMFSLRPGQLSPVFRTAFGYHIIRVDRVQPSEVKARHILIAPVIDSTDVHTALLRADSLANQWRAGANFDSLVAKYHDPTEEKGLVEPFPYDSLPATYQAALTNVQPHQVSAPFALQAANGTTKYAVVQVVTRTAPGQYSLSEVRAQIREQLEREKQAATLLADLRKQTYVSLRL